MSAAPPSPRRPLSFLTRLSWSFSSGRHPGRRAVPGDVLGGGAGSVRPVAGAGRRRQGRAAAHLPRSADLFCRYGDLLRHFGVGVFR